MSNRIYSVGVSTPGMDSATFPRGAEAEWSTLAVSLDNRNHPTSMWLHWPLPGDWHVLVSQH